MAIGKDYDNAAMLMASCYVFRGGERIGQHVVESRMLLWCRSGRGGVVVNGEKFALLPGDFMLLPWGRSISYAADVDDPYVLGGIHVIPDYSREQEIVFSVAHGVEDELYGCAGRRDAAIAGLPDMLLGSMARVSNLEHFAEYAVGYFQRGDPSGEQARMLGRLWVEEMIAVADELPRGGEMLPMGLREMLEYIHEHIGERLWLEDLAEYSGCSVSSVGRMFRRHLGCTALEWITRAKLDYAGRLLTSTRDSVAKVGQMVGIDDAYYFSKLFKKHKGMTASVYRGRFGGRLLG